MANNLIQVLLIEDNPADARMIRELFADARGVSANVECAESLSAGLERVAKGGLDLVLLDLSLPDSRGFETFSRLRGAAKDLPVILLTGLDDEDLAIRALRQGAQDYLVKGRIESQTLARSIRFAVERQKKIEEESVRRRMAAATVVGCLGAKGGVGTTTIVLNTAAVLAQQNKSVVAIELTAYAGSFSLQTQQTPSRTLRHLLDLDPEAITETELKKCLVTLPSGVKAIFAPQKVDEFRQIEPPHAEAIVRCASQMADYVIVDLPTHLSDVSRTVLLQCDRVTLVVERDANSVAACRLAVQLLGHWGIDESAVTAVVVVKDAMASFVPVPELGSRIGCSIAGVIPPAGELCLTANKMGAPFVLLEPDSIPATSLIKVVSKLVDHNLVAALV